MTDLDIDEAYELDAELTAHMLHQLRTKDEKLMAAATKTVTLKVNTEEWDIALAKLRALLTEFGVDVPSHEVDAVRASMKAAVTHA